MTTDATTIFMIAYHTLLPMIACGMLYVLCIKRIQQVSEKKQKFKGRIVPGKFLVHYECPNRHKINFDKDEICPKCGAELWKKE